MFTKCSMFAANPEFFNAINIFVICLYFWTNTKHIHNRKANNSTHHRQCLLRKMPKSSLSEKVIPFEEVLRIML